jgi:hypothetical protein
MSSHPRTPEMNRVFFPLALVCFAISSCHGATVTVVQHSPYRSLNDSPWHDAVAVGDSLKFADQFCNDPATTLPNGLGVHDDFEDNDCYSPWLRIIEGDVGRASGGSVDADDGTPNLTADGASFTQVPNFTAGRWEGRLGFLVTSDGKYPQWFGFDVTGTNDTPKPEMMDLLGVGGQIFATINLSDILGSYRDPELVPDDVFLGFLADQPVTEIVFHDGGLVLDHFQYGYGAAPVPEPTAWGMALVAAAGCLRRRRRQDFPTL